MSDIQEGEFCRTKDGALGKITKVITENIFYVQFYDNFRWKTDLKESGIIKHSFNIIDLIEVGDYVNGWRIDGVSKDKNGHVIYVQNYEVPGFNEREIQSIVTKERFLESEYRINE